MPLNNPNYWRKGALKMRNIAAKVTNVVFKNQLLQMAEEFDRREQKDAQEGEPKW
jgi:hypothetical protein